MPDDYDEFMRKFRAEEFAAGRVPFGKPGEWRLKTVDSDLTQRYTQGVTCGTKKSKMSCIVAYSSEPHMPDRKPFESKVIRSSTFSDNVDTLSFKTVTTKDRELGFGVRFRPGAVDFDFIDHTRARALHPDMPTGRGIAKNIEREEFVYGEPHKWGDTSLPESEYKVKRKGKLIPGKLREYMLQRQTGEDAPEVEKLQHGALPFLIADPRISYTVCAFNARSRQLYCAPDESKLES